MEKCQIIKRSLFMISTILAIFSLYGCTKKAQEQLSETQRSSAVVETPEIPPMSNMSKAPPKDKDRTQELKLDGFESEQKILSFDMTGFTNDGKKKWDIQGKSADIISDTIILSDIEANAYSEDRQVMLKAHSGKYNKEEKSVSLQEDVKVSTTDGIIITAEWLKWESETGMIKTDSFVEVKKDSLYASGWGASADTKSKEVELIKDIVVRQDKITISCGGPLTIDYGNNKASFYDRVKVVEPRGELSADHLDIFFNPDSREIEKVVAESNVELMHGQNVARGQKIVYTLASGEAILTGNPEILIYSKEDMKDAFTGD